MLVDINGDGSYGDAGETQNCSFTVDVFDGQLPDAKCLDIEVKLLVNGTVTIYATAADGFPYIDGGSTDNCDPSPTIEIQKVGEAFATSLQYTCRDVGYNLVNLRVTDAYGNISTCMSRVKVIDYLDGINIALNPPTLCLEANNPIQLDFSNYLSITLANGQSITHDMVPSVLSGTRGYFGISVFSNPMSGTPGTITEDGVYTPGTGTGLVTISYILVPGNIAPPPGNNSYVGCFKVEDGIFELRQPLTMESPECVCGDGTSRTVNLGVITGGLEPYRIQYQGGILDVFGDGLVVDTDGEYTYSTENGHDIEDFEEDLGVLRIVYTQPTWSFTIVDARGCELFRSGSCDNDDLTVGPEIPTLPDTTIFTKFYFCESNLVWEHPLPWDNCAVVKYTYQINNPDGTVSGPFNLIALVNQAPGAPIDSLFRASFDFELGTSVVLYYAEDAVGNFITNQFLVTVIDDDPPYYINCPYPPIVQDAEFGQCDAYVTFSLPIAFDNCALPPSNTQIDNTGLTTGSRFPVGTTVLYWEAIDDFNNRDTCQVKVIVNDYGNYPTLACPTNKVVVNDPWLCSAVVNDIAPTFNNICIDNTRITYSVFKDAALTDRQYCGVWDASGETFDKGTSWIRYRVAGQPLFLITEVAQNGAVDQLEITNLGPAAIDITCLQIERKGANPLADEIIGPISLLPALDGIILGVGEVMVFDFTFNAPGTMPACYTISYMGRVFDQVAVNGFANCSGFTGTLASGNVYRHCEDDSNDASDWALETLCSPLTMGVLNPELDVMPDNGTQTALQSILPNAASCVFTIEVRDEEKPFCGELATSSKTYNGGSITGISPTSCNRSTITVPQADGCIIGNIVFNLTGTATPSNSTITLISPTGIRVGITEVPADTLVDLFAQKSEGIWTLDIVPNPGQTPTVTAWSLAITCIEPYSQPNVTLNNETGLCGASFTWKHAYFIDNCFEGTITVAYTSEDADCVPDGGILVGVSPKGWFGGYQTTQFFCVGTTKVTYILEDVAGNVDSCSFLVTVLDVEDPVVVCPQNIFINLEPGLCRKVVCYYPVSTSDNCEVVDTIYNPPFCSEFEIGIHDVSITVVDEAGNDHSCTFQVHIIEYIPQDKSLKCNDLVQVSLGFNCLSEIYADDILEGNNYRCYDNYVVTVYSGLSPAQPVLPTSPFVTGNEAGKQLLVLVTDPETGNSCWGKISVEDKQPPIIVCPADVTIGCSQAPLPAITGTPAVDDCSPTTSAPNDLYTDLGQCGNPRARIEREWKVTDASNNQTTCKQQITIAGFNLADVLYPTDITISCADVPFPSAVTPEIAGKPAINGTPIDQPGGVCNASYTYTDEVLDICPRSFEILRTWKVRNTCLPLGPNNPAQHVQLISVLDQVPPTLFCPSEHDVKFGGTKKVGSKDCVTNVMLPWVQISDNCSANSALQLWVYTFLPDGTVKTVNTPNQSGFFVFELPVGATYTFTYAAKDGCGNVNECSITLEVRDATPPTTICETFHTVSLTDSVTRVDAISFDDGSYDDCSAVTFAVRRGTMNAAGAFVQHPCNQPGDFLFNPQVRFYCCDALSQTPLFVDLRIRDAWGNDNHCMVEVDVVDKVRPVIWCPDDITVQCGMPFVPTGIDTFQICKQPNLQIKNTNAATYPIPMDIFGIPGDARITDLDLKLEIDHEQVNDLIITLYSPLGLKATVLNGNACAAQSVNIARNIRVTFNDHAYDIAFFNQTGVRNPALFTCTQAMPSVGAYNQGHMKPQGDELKIFNGQPLNSFTAKDKCFTAGQNDINAATNRISNFQVQQFIQQAGLQTNDRVLMEYSSATGQALEGLSVGSVYLFQVINSNTIELLPLTGDDIISVPAGSNHMFCVSGTWLLVVEDTKPLAGGIIKEVCLNIGYAQPTGLKPYVTDNTEECGLTVTHQDLGQPDKCADGTFINRRWTVTDAFNNNTSCIQRVYFADDTPLTVQFPCDVTVNCPISPDATGEVLHNTDCELTAVTFTDHTLVTTDGCYKILRTWVVKDWCSYGEDGNVDYTITNVNEALNQVTFNTAINALITARKIAVGDRVTLRYVTSGTTEIPGMIEGDVYSLVRISGTTFRVDYNTTKQQSVNITGQGLGPHVFRFANSALGLPVTCDVLLEWYPFVDWYTSCCNPAAVRRAWEDDGDGYFSFVQEIKVVDNVAPQWVDCADLNFCSFEANCEPTFVEILSPALDNCADSTQLNYTWTIDLYNDGTVDLEGVSADASGAYPNGTHKVVFKVSDRCGNWNTCTRLFTIRDCKKPTPICINGLSVDLMPSTGMATVWATSLEAGDSYDNCTDYEKLTILVERFSNLSPGQSEPGAGTNNEVVVTCDDLPPTSPSPEVEVVVWVGDEAGNWDYCITTIWVQDNMGACGDPQNSHLVANFFTEEQEPVSMVQVELSGSIQATQVAMGGTTTFQDLPYGQSAMVSPHKDIMPLNGVSTYDLLLIQKHLLGIKSLNSPYKMIAADVNNSCGLSVSDIIELRKMILNPGQNFKNNTSWRFVDKQYVFPNPNKPCAFPEIKSFQQLGVMNSANFVAVKIGDVSGDAAPNSLLGGETRNFAGTLAFRAEDVRMRAGEERTVIIRAGDFVGIQGYQFTLDADPGALRLLEVTPLWDELTEANFGREAGAYAAITTSWNSSNPVDLAKNTELFAVRIQAISDLSLSEVMKVNSRVTRAEAYDKAEEMLDVQLRFDGAKLPSGFVLHQNEPNPFSSLTKIGFELPLAGEAVLTVHDITGKVVYRHKGDYPRGYSELLINRAELPGTGMLYYTLQSGEHIATLRMTLLD
jgi:subtilisin-like proprotein convertase family protein